MNKLTTQQMFDATVTHIFSLPRRAGEVVGGESGDIGFRCRYHTASGLKCAIGYWIPDGHEAGNSAMSVRQLGRWFADIDDILTPSDAEAFHTANATMCDEQYGDVAHTLLWQDLQAVHDCEDYWDGGFTTDGAEALAKHAARWRLSDAVITTWLEGR